MTRLWVQAPVAWLLIYSYSFTGVSGYEESFRALRRRSPIDIVVPDVDVPPDIEPAEPVPEAGDPEAGDPEAGNPNSGDPIESPYALPTRK
jgi:hypothetical protein